MLRGCLFRAGLFLSMVNWAIEMNRYEKIRSDLDGNPVLYGLMSDQKVADEMNRLDPVVRPKKLTTLQILDLLGPINGAAFIVALEAVAATNNVVRLAIRSMDAVGVDVGNAATRDMIDLLVADTVLGKEDSELVKSAAIAHVSKAEQLGLQPVRAGHVATAKALK